MHIGATDIDEKRLRDDLKTACDEGKPLQVRKCLMPWVDGSRTRKHLRYSGNVINF